ncbi:MAG: hypothetical protein LC776_13320 [Acidobacteria bacterium]|nr:hypothetical protein [Acidobacteriota bacterium]
MATDRTQVRIRLTRCALGGEGRMAVEAAARAVDKQGVTHAVEVDFVHGGSVVSMV